MKKQQLIKYSSIILRIIIAVIFLLAGSGKFQTGSIMASNFKNWSLGISMMYIVGVFEILGALFLFIPKKVTYGCYVLITIMLGAIVVHISNFEELGFPYLNITLIAMLLFIMNSRN